ncbi:origin recognition complex subunit 2-domain-containing protein [Mucor mucedo]|uniref:origin recognition complex subunit 2-domain-containing protein n=1 Tax=Mucor mucedo TaxID=29922 RepID=UPI002220A9D4|nr:origin recognition complex subunit 2-domain-containing protein [Mucor mucedo]KAI7894298.1 origin recognition complex subunit 2-domain-containing protein [Mucor mucedo]
MSFKIHSQTDEEIPIHIVSTVDAKTLLLEEKLAKSHKARSKKTLLKASDYLDVGLTVNKNQSLKERSASPMNEDESVQSLTHYKPSHHDDKENADLSGRSIFNFQHAVKKTPNGMMKKALVLEGEEPVKTSSRVKKTTKHQLTKVAPDHTKRRRVERQMELLKDNRNSSEEEQDTSSEEEKEELEDDDDDEEEEKKKKSMFHDTEGYERYFQDLHTSSKTSNNTLSKLQVLEPQEFHQILADAPRKHEHEIAILSEMHKQHFPQWFFELHSGFNLVFYGYGSKRNLLNEFAQSSLTDGPLIVVNGFFPSISIKDILLKISAGALGTTGPTGQISDHVKFICDYFADPDREYESLYIVIHNLDGPNLRNERTQTALSMLANADNIHLVASVDHINAGLLWDNILAEHQLPEMELANMEGKGNESVGLSYNQYYQKCREGFFVSSDLAFKTELTEFKDHKLISTKKGLDGTEFFLYLWIRRLS